MPPTYLITAPSGNIGKRLVPLLISSPSKPKLVLVTSNPDRLKSQLPTEVDEARLRVVHGDINDPIFLETVFKEHGVTAAFLCLTGLNELMVTLNFFDAMSHAGCVKHLVYLSACGDYDLGAIQAGKLRSNAASHVLVKFILEAKLRYGFEKSRGQPGGFSWTIIGPSLFFDNDLRTKESILTQRFFDEPLGSRGVSRVDPEDIALAVANALQDDGQVWGGKKVMVGSLETYTDNDVTKLWSEALGVTIKPAKGDGDGLAAFEGRFRPKWGPMWARDMRLMYEWFEAEGLSMTRAEYDDQVALLGKEPASYEKFVVSTAEEWKGLL
jgi:uncharacterized protein YbjT (DUF2867 family)